MLSHGIFSFSVFENYEWYYENYEWYNFVPRISFKRKKPDKNVFGIELIELKKDLNILGIKWDSAVQIFKKWA